jgi:hypothetical protein
MTQTMYAHINEKNFYLDYFYNRVRLFEFKNYKHNMNISYFK